MSCPKAPPAALAVGPPHHRRGFRAQTFLLFCSSADVFWQAAKKQKLFFARFIKNSCELVEKIYICKNKHFQKIGQRGRFKTSVRAHHLRPVGAQVRAGVLMLGLSVSVF